MPLVQGKSKQAFVENLKREHSEGKPMAQSLAIAYNIKNRNAQKKAHGGMVNEKLHPEHEPEEASMHEHAKALAHHILSTDPEYANGGMVEDHLMNDNAGMMESPEDEHSDDFLSADEESPFEHQDIEKMAHGGEVEMQEGDEPNLKEIMAKVRMKHMGR